MTGTGTGRSMGDAPRSSINIIRRSEKETGAAVASLPSIVFDHVSQLDDELSLFVLLTALKRVLLWKTHKRENQTHTIRFLLAYKRMEILHRSVE